MAPDDLPPLPAGRTISLEGRGEVFIRQAGAHNSGPPFVLLHGWTVTSDLNWFAAYGPLAERHHVIAVDHRGHGRGLRSQEPFSLEQCADDVVALMGEMGVDSIIPCGYSMGGLVAQLVWHRHRPIVAGLVLAATARNFRGTPLDRVLFSSLTGLASAWRLAPGTRRDVALERYLDVRVASLPEWAAAEMRRGDVRTMIEAGAAIGAFSSARWITDLDVPSAMLVNTLDTKIPTARQRKLAAALPDALVLEVEGDHHVCTKDPDRFVPKLTLACDFVAKTVRNAAA